MADAKISALPSATTPLAGTEVLPVVQGGVTDKVTVANLTAGRAVAASSLTLGNGAASTPSLVFANDATAGFFSPAAASLDWATSGQAFVRWSNSRYRSLTTGSWQLTYAVSSATVPSLVPNSNDTTTGIGSQASGNLSLIAGGAEIGRVTSGGLLLTGTQTITGGTVVVSTPVLNATQTWNAGGVTFTGMKLNVTDTASATASRLFELQVGGADRFHVTKAGAGHFAFSVRAQSNSAVISLGASDDTILAWDAANTLALRNGVNAQTFNVYNTYTDASNYEVGQVKWSGNILIFGAQALGSGTLRSARLAGGSSTSQTYFNVGPTGFLWAFNGSQLWSISTSGHFLAGTTNTYDIGTSTTVAAPRNIYAGTDITAGGSLVATNSVYVGANQRISFGGKGYLLALNDAQFSFYNAAGTNSFTITAGASNLATFNGGITATLDLTLGNGYDLISPTKGRVRFGVGDGVITLTNAAATDFSRLQFGGTTSSFPAIKRSGAALQIRLADDSTWGSLDSGSINTQTNILYFSTRGYISATSDGAYKFANGADTQSFTMTAGASNLATFNGPINTLKTTVASLPTAGTAGRRAFVTDALAPTFGSAVTGGGAVNVPVYDTGAAWFVG